MLKICTIFKPGAHKAKIAPGFLKLLWLARWYVCVCVCPPPRPLITSHMKGTCNNWIIKFYSYSLFCFFVIMTLPSMNWIGVDLVTLWVMNACQSKVVLVTEGPPTSWSVSIIKVSGRMYSNAFKRRLGFSFNAIILTWNNFILLLKLRH